MWRTNAIGLFLACSLAHFIHNAEFLADYPNMPAWITRADVYWAWLGLAALAAAGYLLLKRGSRWIGPAALAGAALFGLDSLGHYWLAPFNAHSPMMSLTILAEVSSAAVLLVAASTVPFVRIK